MKLLKLSLFSPVIKYRKSTTWKKILLLNWNGTAMQTIVWEITHNLFHFKYIFSGKWSKQKFSCKNYLQTFRRSAKLFEMYEWFVPFRLSKSCSFECRFCSWKRTRLNWLGQWRFCICIPSAQIFWGLEIKVSSVFMIPYFREIHSNN